MVLPSFLGPSSTGSAKISDFCENMFQNGRLLGSLGHPWVTLGLHLGRPWIKNVPKCASKFEISRFLKIVFS